MKTPISILCISDLHLKSSKSEPISNLGTNLLEFANNNSNEQAICWVPDYIVIAGDFVDQGKNDYQNASDHIHELLEAFKIKEDHVIVVPGNHDNNIDDYTLEIYKEECDIFEKYQKDASVSSSREKFWRHYSKKYSDYISFCKKFMDKNGGNEYLRGDELFPDDSKEPDNSVKLDSKELGLLSGVRCFKDDSLCFVYVNTEWLYVAPKNILKIDGAIEKKYLEIKEKCKLCAPLVNDAFDLIKQEYQDATVITVMHRFFNDLNILEYNHTDKAKKDPVRQIEEISDIILSGHEHRVSIDPPSYIKNWYQHISIGTSMQNSTRDTVPPRTACVININPAQKVLKLLSASYDDINKKWSFFEDVNQYPLHPSDEKNENNKEVGKIPRIKARRVDDTILKNAIMEYFRIKKEDPVEIQLIKNNTSETRDELENALRSRNSETLLLMVVYRTVFDNGSIDATINDEVVSAFRKDHFADMLDNVIIKEIDVVVPPPINVND